jgi:hypothetical protein
VVYGRSFCNPYRIYYWSLAAAAKKPKKKTVKLLAFQTILHR